MNQAVSDLQTPRETTGKKGRRNRLARLGVDLSKYPGVRARDLFEPIIAPINRDLLWSLVRSYKDQLIHRVPDPCVLTHIVTTRCNYNCPFCSFADSLNIRHNELTLAEIEKVYQTVGSGVNVIIYSGGEPTINSDLPGIIEAAYRHTAVQSVFIVSNAWRPQLLLEITHHIAQSCPDLHLTWSLSIEGPKDVNNALRCTKNKEWDAWQNTVDAMEALKAIRKRFDYRKLDIQLCTVCSPSNAHILNQWYETVRDELKPDKWNLNLMRRSVQMSESNLPTFDQRRACDRFQAFESAYIEVSERMRRDELAGRLKCLYHMQTPQAAALKSAVDLMSQEANRNTLLEHPAQLCCKAGTMGAYISNDGEVSACEEFAHAVDENKSFGNLREENCDFQKVWRGNTAAQFREQVGHARECRGCTLESQRNYPSILASFKNLFKARKLAKSLSVNARGL